MPDGLKNAIIAVIICAVLFYIGVCISGCGESTQSSSSQEPVTHNMIGINALIGIPIGERLYYDYTTGIVYWWNGTIEASWSTTPTPYYSPNGLLYRYIPETNMLEEIKPYSTSMEGEK